MTTAPLSGAAALLAGVLPRRGMARPADQGPSLPLSWSPSAVMMDSSGTSILPWAPLISPPSIIGVPPILLSRLLSWFLWLSSTNQVFSSPSAPCPPSLSQIAASMRAECTVRFSGGCLNTKKKENRFDVCPETCSLPALLYSTLRLCSLASVWMTCMQ